jgi:hypothetical protein
MFDVLPQKRGGVSAQRLRVFVSVQKRLFLACIGDGCKLQVIYIHDRPLDPPL